MPTGSWLRRDIVDVGRPNALSAKGSAEREGFNPSWRVSPPTAFPESVRSPTGPVWDRLLNTNGKVTPTVTDWIRPPVGIGVGITRVLRIDSDRKSTRLNS